MSARAGRARLSRLTILSLQVNMRAGRFPEPEDRRRKATAPAI